MPHDITPGPALFLLSDANTRRSYIKEKASGPAWVDLGRSGPPAVDFSRSDSMQPYVSQSFVDALWACGASGWSHEQVPGLSMNGEPAHRLTITGRSRGTDLRHDEHAREVLYPGGWFPESACFDPIAGGWDGSDLVRPEDTEYIVLTEPAHNALTAHALRVLITEVGRDRIDLSLAYSDGDEDDPFSVIEAWRHRMGAAPGSRAGTAECPDLLSRGRA